MQKGNTLTNQISKISGIKIIRASTQSDLDACLRIRHEVFTIEQGIDPVLDDDGKDACSIHYLALYSLSVPVGTARVIPLDDIAQIGRLAMLKNFRKSGIGLAMLKWIMDDLHSYGFSKLILHSQVSVVPFYEKMGFLCQGYEYYEAGTPHITMTLSLKPQENSL